VSECGAELEPGHRVNGSVILSGSRRVSGESYLLTDPVSWTGFWQNNRMIQQLFLCREHMNALCNVAAQWTRSVDACSRR